MKIFRIRSILNNNTGFRFIKLEHIVLFNSLESNGILIVSILLNSGESLQLINDKLTKKVFDLGFAKFKSTENIFFDLSKFRIK